MKIGSVGLAACVLVACSSTEGSETFACSLGSLEGTWRIHYEETDGNCGEIADETVVQGATDPGADSCTYAASTVSADKCRWDTDFTCPTTDQRGTQRWTGVMTQTGEEELSGSMTVQLKHPMGTCRGTYRVVWMKQ